MDRIGVRELRQHASRYLARVVRGETLQVTDRGRPIALLTPVPADPWEQMIADGRVIPAEEAGGSGDIEPLPPVDPPLSETLLRMREDERW